MIILFSANVLEELGRIDDIHWKTRLTDTSDN